MDRQRRILDAVEAFMASDRLFKDVDVLEETLEALFDQEEEIEAAEQRGYDNGLDNGRAEGFDDARSEGYDEGWELAIREALGCCEDDATYDRIKALSNA